MFADLFASAETVLQTAQSALTIHQGTVPGTVVGPANITVTVSPGLTPIIAARVGIGLMCQYLEDNASTAVPMATLTTYIDNIATYDRPALRARLGAFYTKYGSGLTVH